MGAASLRPQTETLDDVPVRSDYVSTDGLFRDALVMLKPYRHWGEPDYDATVKYSDALAYYFVMVTGDGPVNLRMQHYSLHAKRQIGYHARRLVDRVCQNNPEETQIADDNYNALMTIVDSYVDNIQTECIDNARNVGA